MTPQTLFTSWQPYSSGEYPGQGSLIAYFSMEIAITPAIPTYSGGLGVLAGDTLRAAADMALPLVAVTLAHRKGYVKQRLDANGVQSEEDQPWDLEATLTPEEPVITVLIEGSYGRDSSLALRPARRNRSYDSHLPARYRSTRERPAG